MSSHRQVGTWPRREVAVGGRWPVAARGVQEAVDSRKPFSRGQWPCEEGPGAQLTVPPKEVPQVSGAAAAEAQVWRVGGKVLGPDLRRTGP